jgi:hypothetical protein
LVLVTLDVLLPHAAINTVAAPTATVTANEVCLTVSSRGKVPGAGHGCGAPSRVRLPGDYFVGVSEGRVFAVLGALVAKLRPERDTATPFPRIYLAPVSTESITLDQISRGLPGGSP